MQIEGLDTDRLKLDADTTFVDIGCGRGTILIPMRARARRVIGLDLNLDYLRDAREAAGPDEAALAQGRAEQLPFPSGVFDVVLCRETLEHVAEPALVLSELRRVLAPGGRLCVSVPYHLTERILQLLNPRWLELCGHRSIFSPGTLSKLMAQAGLRVTVITRERFYHTVFWFFHCIVRTPHDGTGRPLGHHGLTRWLERGWRWLNRVPGGAALVRLGDRLLPKSIYVYATVDEPSV
jgi:SAM-dependent methyltransferase